MPTFRVPFALALFAAALACASTPESSDVDSAAPAQPCTASVSAIDLSAWQEARGSEFSFCVPSGWTRSGRRWQSGSTNVTWGTGSPRGGIAGSGTLVGRPAGSGGSGGMPPGNTGDSERMTETIGGRRADLVVTRSSQLTVTAYWPERDVHLVVVGQPSREQELLAVVRSLRFGTP